MACAPGRGITAGTSPGIAGGSRCAGERLGRKVTTLARGAGLAAGRRGRWRSGRVAPTGGPGASVGAATSTWEKLGAGLLRAGFWAGDLGQAREARGGGLGLAALGRTRVAVGLGFVFSISLSLLFLIQTKFEFKYNLNSNHTQIIKTMHQHECNNKFLNL